MDQNDLRSCLIDSVDSLEKFFEKNKRKILQCKIMGVTIYILGCSSSFWATISPAINKVSIGYYNANYLVPMLSGIYFLITLLSTFFNIDGRVTFAREMNYKIIDLRERAVKMKFEKNLDSNDTADIIVEIETLISSTFTLLRSTSPTSLWVPPEERARLREDLERRKSPIIKSQKKLDDSVIGQVPPPNLSKNLTIA